MDYVNPYVFGGNIILCTASGGHNGKVGGTVNYNNATFEPPWKDNSSIHHHSDSREFTTLDPNTHGAPTGFSGYAARIEGSQGACSVRYYIKGGAGRHWAYEREDYIGGVGHNEQAVIDAVPGEHFDAKTGWMHWADGDTGIRHFAVRVNPDSDAYTDDSVKRMCVVIDMPSGCGLKACIGLDCEPLNPNQVLTGIQYYEMRSDSRWRYEVGGAEEDVHESFQAGAWPPVCRSRAGAEETPADTWGLYTSPFGDPTDSRTPEEVPEPQGPATGFLFPYAPRLEMTCIIDAAASEE
jgi:hypothetical protein